MAKRAGRKRGRRRLGIIGRAISVLIICAAIFLAITIFFKVSTVTVEGDSRYSYEEIVEASGVNIGDHMFFLSQSTIAANIQSELYYVGEVSVSRHYPDRLVITVNDNEAVGYIALSGGYWLLDKNCKLLEKVDADGIGNAVQISGITPVLPSEGSVINVEESEADKVLYLSEILTYSQKQGILEGISSIDMDNVSNPRFEYMDRFTVKMGAYTDVEYKLQMLTEVIQKLSDTDRGVIDLSNTSKISFQPG